MCRGYGSAVWWGVTKDFDKNLFLLMFMRHQMCMSRNNVFQEPAVDVISKETHYFQADRKLQLEPTMVDMELV